MRDSSKRNWCVRMSEGKTERESRLRILHVRQDLVKETIGDGVGVGEIGTGDEEVGDEAGMDIGTGEVGE